MGNRQAGNLHALFGEFAYTTRREYTCQSGCCAARLHPYMKDWSVYGIDIILLRVFVIAVLLLLKFEHATLEPGIIASILKDSILNWKMWVYFTYLRFKYICTYVEMLLKWWTALQMNLYSVTMSIKRDLSDGNVWEVCL